MWMSAKKLLRENHNNWLGVPGHIHIRPNSTMHLTDVNVLRYEKSLVSLESNGNTTNWTSLVHGCLMFRCPFCDGQVLLNCDDCYTLLYLEVVRHSHTWSLMFVQDVTVFWMEMSSTMPGLSQLRLTWQHIRSLRGLLLRRWRQGEW